MTRLVTADRRLCRLLGVALFFASMASAAVAQESRLPQAADPAALAAPRIGLLTIDPGQPYWSRFGHNAVVVAWPGTRPISYNFGWFDFNQPGFLLRFVRGRMLYRLVAMDLADDVAGYREEGRGVRLQWLTMDADRARDLATALAIEARPENADYLYEYFEANCSTRVRDVLDRGLAGALAQSTKLSPTEHTFRSEALRLGAPIPWLYAGMHFGLGPATDRSLSRWQLMFLPEHVEAAVAALRSSDGRPVAEASIELVPAAKTVVLTEAPTTWPWFALAGLALALTGTWLGSRPRRRGLFAGLIWVVLGSAGAALLFLWLGTNHFAAHRNANLLLANPLNFVLLPTAARIMRGRCASSRAGAIALVLAAVALAAPLIAVLSNGQSLTEWWLLLTPIQIVLAGWVVTACRQRPNGPAGRGSPPAPRGTRP